MVLKKGEAVEVAGAGHDGVGDAFDLDRGRAPRPDGAVRFDRRRVVGAGRDRGDGGDAFEADGKAETLTAGENTPHVDVSVGGDGNVVGFATGDGDDVLEFGFAVGGEDPDGGGLVVVVSDAELAHTVMAPGPDGAIGGEGDGFACTAPDGGD